MTVESGTGSPIVSVVMTAHNAELFVGDALSTLRSQTLTDFEVIVVNDGSTDRTWTEIEACAAEDARIRAINLPHVGRVEALNTACRASQGDYIAILDADDRALPERLERQTSFLRRNPNVALLGSAVTKISSDGRAFGTATFPVTDAAIRPQLLEHAPFAHSAVVMVRRAVLDVGAYRKAFAPAEDYDLWLRLSERFELANLPESLVEYRVHLSQVSSTRIVAHTLGVLGARAGAALRRQGLPDETAALDEITPEFLAAHGVSPSVLQEQIVNAFLTTSLGQWLSGAAALSVATLERGLDWAQSERCEPALTARLYSLLATRRLRQGRVQEALRAFSSAYSADGREARALFWRGLTKLS